MLKRLHLDYQGMTCIDLFFFIHQPSRVWICLTVNAAGTNSPDQFFSRKIMICLSEDYGVANTVAK